MNRLFSKTSAHRLVEICVQKGMRYAVISPGSRNAPLTISLGEHPDIECLNIPDERVAGFFALGMAQQLESPVILCCTSGSAGLNYAPALVEAYYQKIPLLVLTADRPPEWIDQRAGQTMRQAGMYGNYVKASHTLICDPSNDEEIWYNDRIVNQAIDQSIYGGAGPVHINMPFKEPLYDLDTRIDLSTPKLIRTIQRTNHVANLDQERLQQEWNSYNKVLIIIGQHLRSQAFDDALLQLSRLDHTIILTETTSNVCVNGVFRSIDRLIDSLRPEEYGQFAPDLIISSGGPIVSKKLRFMLRDMKVNAHWHVDEEDQYIDTYKALTQNIPMRLEELVPIIISSKTDNSGADWKNAWEQRERITLQLHREYLETCEWSDLQVLHSLHRVAASGSWHAANSTPVRYTQLFETRLDLVYRSNRGVSGVDGCTSTAAGAAFISGDLVTLVTGDIAFFYDSNAFWHHHVSNNLRVFMLNNSGGNIFRYVNGPMKTEQFEEHFEAYHNTSADGIAQAYGVTYRKVKNLVELNTVIEEVYSSEFNEPVVVEVVTPRLRNIEVLKEYFSHIQGGVTHE